MHKTRYVFPVIGGRKVEHLVSNLEALDIALTSEHIKAIESVVPFDLGFPGAIFVSLSHHLLMLSAAIGTYTAFAGRWYFL